MPNKSKKNKGEIVAQTSQTALKTSEVKHDPVNKNEKAQPTAEQMRIAQITSNTPEDPALKEKIKQVMDATQKSEDEVCTALHDCDNDPNRAVNLLLEGGQSEWTTSIKKKKTKPASEKVINSTEEIVSVPAPKSHVEETEDWNEPEEVSNITASKPPTEGRGRGSRGGFGFSRTPGRPWRGRDNKENYNRSFDRGGRPFRGGRIANGSTSGRGRGRGSARGRSLAHGRPFTTWGEGCPIPVEDWDNEEYTGSLADSKVFTPSTLPTEPVAKTAVEPDPVTKDLIQLNAVSEGSVKETEPRSTFTTSQFINQSFSSAQVQPLAPSAKPPSSVFQESHFNSSIQSDNFSNKFGVNSYSSVTEGPPTTIDERMPRSKSRPRIPPPSKIPSSAVEMPPDAVGSGMALLDVQFGALDLGDTSEHNASSPQSTASSQSDTKLAQQTTPSYQPVQPSISEADSLLLNESSFSPVRTAATTNSLPNFSDMNMKQETSLYQDIYPTSQYSKPHSQPSTTMYNQSYSSSQYSAPATAYSSTTTHSSTFSSGINSYTNSTAAYPQQSQTGNYNPISYASQSQNLPFTQLHSTNSYQGSNQYASATSQSGYGPSSGRLGTVNSYSASTPSYQSYSYPNSIHNHKPGGLASTTSSNKDFEVPASTVNLNSIAQSTNSINATPSLLSSTQTTPTTKQSVSSMGKNVMPNVPPGVAPLVGTQYVMSQSGMPYFQQPVYGTYDELQLLSQQRLSHIPTGYYDVAYQPPSNRESVQYNVSDTRQFVRADNNASPVPSSSLTQASGSQVNQQPVMNPAAGMPTYAYFYGNFQYGAPALYPVAATGTGSGHVNSNSAYAKGPTTFAGSYGGAYESGQGAGGDYKQASSQPPKASQPNVQSTNDLSAVYSKSQHGALSKVNSYDKQTYSGTPPPYTLSSQTSGLGPAGGYPPQHLYVPTINPHHSTALIHQPLHQDPVTGSSRSQVPPNQNKVGGKSSYSASPFWAPP